MRPIVVYFFVFFLKKRKICSVDLFVLSSWLGLFKFNILYLNIWIILLGIVPNSGFTGFEQYEIILACRKTVLKNNDSTWVKNGLDNFDVPMGGYDSSQIADLVGLYILDILTRIISPQQVGLYRWWVIIYPK